MYKLHSIIFIITVPISYKIRITEGSCNAANSLGLSPTVELSTGSVQGLSCLSALDLPYFSFRGIPYAAPPLGDLRFRAPQPPSRWESVLNATVEPPACLQLRDLVNYPISYSEDCLTLNVFTPYLKHPSGNHMPVIVFLHGGNFHQGSSSSYRYGPDFFLAKEVILVTFNFRLGVFGYLNMNISEAQGNAALKDAVAVLKWVKREIIHFGGDPNLVTINGDSSGAAAVTLLYLSPMTKGLFSRAISHSGPPLFFPSTIELGLQLAHALGCHSPTHEGIVACLRAVDADKLVEKQSLFSGMHGFDNPFIPTLEAGHGEEVFLPGPPHTLLAQAHAVPYLMGLTNGEGLMYISDPAEDPDQFTNLGDEVMKHLPAEFLETARLPILQEVVSRVNKFYFTNRSSLPDKVDGFVNYMSDKQFHYGVIKTAKLISVQAPVYFYYFTFEGEFQARDHEYYKLNFSVPGVCHGEELGYFFYRNYTLAAHNNLFAYPRDMNMVDRMTSIWTNFAIYGDPTPFQPKELNATWLPMKGELTQYLLIGDAISMIRSPLLQEAMTFWDNLYNFVYSNKKKTVTVQNFLRTGTCLLLVCLVMISILFVKNYRKHKDYINWK